MDAFAYALGAAPVAVVGARELALIAWQRGRGRPAWLRAFEEAHGPIEGWWASRRAVIRGAGLRADVGARLTDPSLDDGARRDVDRIAHLGWRLLRVSEVFGVAELPEPPLFLLARGQLPADTPSVSVVGARRATGYGLRVTRKLVGEVAGHGVSIISGLARGIDAAAHRAALDTGGHTVAVLGAGPDVVYPPENRRLQEAIAERGMLLTEHLPGVPPRPRHFPRRNRILVALASALLVVEGRIKSGTLTSVRWAADLGRDVLVIPGPIDSLLSEGPLQLLREGATPVGECVHVLEALGLAAGTNAPEVAAWSSSRVAVATTAAEERVLTLLAGDGLDLDDLVRLSGESPGRLLTLLLALEVGGRVIREPDGLRYRAI